VRRCRFPGGGPKPFTHHLPRPPTT
jgi:hypothetical protein